MSDEQLDPKLPESFEELTSTIFRFDEEGDMLIGTLVAVEPFEASEFDTEALKYTVKNDLGRWSCVLGEATDRQLGDGIQVGDTVCFLFLGQGETKNGNKVNRFKVAVKRD